MPPDLPTGGADTGKVPAEDGPWLERWRDEAWRRWRGLAGLYGAVLGLGAALLVHAILIRSSSSAPGWIAAIVGLLVLVAVVARTRGVRDVRPVLVEAERAQPDLRNALLAWHESGRDLSPGVAARLAAQARAPLTTAAWPHPHGRASWSAALGCVALVAVADVLLPHSLERGTATPTATGQRSASSAPMAVPLDWTATVTPPTYAGAPSTRLTRPTRVEALAGSRLELTFTSWRAGSTVRFGADPVPVDEVGTAPVATWPPSPSSCAPTQRHESASSRRPPICAVQPRRVSSPSASRRRTTSDCASCACGTRRYPEVARASRSSMANGRCR
jgi:hypothetical protein